MSFLSLSPPPFMYCTGKRVPWPTVDEEGDLVTQVKCPKSYKEYFTVIKNVKKAHEINDFGEFQEFNDDVDYIIDGLSSRHKISLRLEQNSYR